MFLCVYFSHWADCHSTYDDEKYKLYYGARYRDLLWCYSTRKLVAFRIALVVIGRLYFNEWNVYTDSRRFVPLSLYEIYNKTLCAHNRCWHCSMPFLFLPRPFFFLKRLAFIQYYIRPVSLFENYRFFVVSSCVQTGHPSNTCLTTSPAASARNFWRMLYQLTAIFYYIFPRAAAVGYRPRSSPPPPSSSSFRVYFLLRTTYFETSSIEHGKRMKGGRRKKKCPLNFKVTISV